MDKLLKLLNENGFTYSLNEPMNRHTTFRIGGNAKLFVEVNNLQRLSLLTEYCSQNSIEYLTVGKGSNLLVSDDGIDGVVITLDGNFNEIKLVDETTIYAGAGVSLASLCKFALKNELTGLEFAYGIPGSVGGAVFMNAGAYGGEMKDVVSKTEHIDSSGKTGFYNSSELNFGYRKSVYSPTDLIITSVEFNLKKGNQEEISSKMNELFGRRKDKQPLEYPSAGSVFKRPEGYFAGALIEQSGLKGKTIGGAAVSEKHAGFIINKGGATCNDVKELIKFCQNTVFEKFSVNLETEIKLV